MSTNESRFSSRGKSLQAMVVPPALAVAALVAALAFFDGAAEEEKPRDAGLCPVDQTLISGTAVILFDFTKPLDSAHAALPGKMLWEVAQNLRRDTEMQVYSLTHSPGAPRLLLKRLCTAHDIADLDRAQSQGKTAQHQPDRLECGEFDALPSDDVGRSVKQFCAAWDALQADLYALATSAPAQRGSVADAYLVEALEDTILDLARKPDSGRVLYVFSDMMQHAPWYSHLDLTPTDWDSREFADVLKAQNWAFSHRIDRPELRVEVFYVPRVGRTDQKPAKDHHQDFWRHYFAGAEVAFHDQISMSDYAAVPLMNVPTEAEIAASERAAVEQLLLKVQQEQEALEMERQEVVSERQPEAAPRSRRLAQRQ